MTDFLQSPEWEEFQKTLGRKTWRLGGTLFIQHQLPFGLSSLYVPHPASLGFLEEARVIARKEGAVFLKIDPAEELRVKKYESRTVSSRAFQPRKTIILNLQKSEEELFVAMHEKTRYNVRLAERKVVLVKRGEDFEVFWKLLRETAERDKFSTHERGYYEKLLAEHSENFSNELFFAGFKEKIVAAAMINFYRPSGTATYLHGASSREYRDVMAPHILHWRIIQEAKRRGFRYYDFWGVDEKKWPGVTRFKMGFGGNVVEYPPSVDIIYRRGVYLFYKFIRRNYYLCRGLISRL